MYIHTYFLHIGKLDNPPTVFKTLQSLLPWFIGFRV